VGRGKGRRGGRSTRTSSRVLASQEEKPGGGGIYHELNSGRGKWKGGKKTGCLSSKNTQIIKKGRQRRITEGGGESGLGDGGRRKVVRPIIFALKNERVTVKKGSRDWSTKKKIGGVLEGGRGHKEDHTTHKEDFVFFKISFVKKKACSSGERTGRPLTIFPGGEVFQPRRERGESQTPSKGFVSSREKKKIRRETF